MARGCWQHGHASLRGVGAGLGERYDVGGVRRRCAGRVEFAVVFVQPSGRWLV